MLPSVGLGLNAAKLESMPTVSMFATITNGISKVINSCSNKQSEANKCQWWFTDATNGYDKSGCKRFPGIQEVYVLTVVLLLRSTEVQLAFRSCYLMCWIDDPVCVVWH